MPTASAVLGPIKAAVLRHRTRRLAPSAMRTAEWAGVQEAIRSRAFIVAGLEDARIADAMRDKLKGQDYLTTVVEQDVGKSEARVTGAMIDFLDPHDRGALIETIAKAAIAVGADGLFFETHPDPASAKSDGANMLPLDLFEGLLERLVRLRAAL